MVIAGPVDFGPWFLVALVGWYAVLAGVGVALVVQLVRFLVRWRDRRRG